MLAETVSAQLGKNNAKRKTRSVVTEGVCEGTMPGQVTEADWGRPIFKTMGLISILCKTYKKDAVFSYSLIKLIDRLGNDIKAVVEDNEV